MRVTLTQGLEVCEEKHLSGKIPANLLNRNNLSYKSQFVLAAYPVHLCYFFLQYFSSTAFTASLKIKHLEVGAVKMK